MATLSCENETREGRITASCIYLKCKSEAEFMSVYEKLKHVEETKQSGCPIDEHGHYEDIIAYIPRNNRSVEDMESIALKRVEQYRDLMTNG